MPALSFLKRLLLLIILLPGIAYGQASLRGTVTDAANKETLIGVNVIVLGTSLGAATDIEGQYWIVGIPTRVFSIKFSYVGYEPQIKEIDFSKTKDVTIDIQLTPAIIEGEEVVVTAQMRGQIAAINQQITSKTIINVVSEEKIKELPDANAAEAIGRLPGVSLIRSGGEANKVILRGLADKYTNITIDGVKIPATDATSRSVDLSMLSQSSLAGIELFKALTPDKDGDGLAGSINLVTRKAPEERTFRADIKGNYNHLTRSANQYDFAFHYGERFFDNILGLQLTGNLEKKLRSNERINVDYANEDYQTGYNISNFILEFTDEVRKREGLTVLMDFNTPDEGTIRFNNVFSSTNRDYLWTRRDYPSGTGGNYGGFPSYDYRDQTQDIKTFNSSIRGDNRLFGLVVTWGASYAESQAEYPFDYELIFVEPSGMAGSNPIKTHPEQLIAYAFNNFHNASLYWAYYRTQDNFDKEKTAYLDVAKQYTLGDIFSGEIKIGGKYKAKDRSNVRTEDLTPYYLGKWKDYELLPDGTFKKKDFAGTVFSPWFQQTGGLPGTGIGLIEFLPSPSSTRNIYDSYLLNPLISRDALHQWRDLNKYGIDATGNVSEIWHNSLIRYDEYFTTERVSSAYIMNTLNVGQDLTIIAGVRIEQENNDYLSTYMTGQATGFPLPDNINRDTTSSYIQTVLLPNLNIAFKPIEPMNIRLAVYKALARPDFNMRLNRLISGRPAEAGSNFEVYVGNTSLKTAEAWNYEVNTSYSSNTIGLVSISAYYKEISDMFHMLNDFNAIGDSILQKVFGSKWSSNILGTPYSLTIPYNSPKPTKVWGFEFEHQINFNFLTGFLQNFSLTYNASVVRSEAFIYGSKIVKYTDYSGPIPLIKSRVELIERKQKLEGMPEFFANVALGYDIAGFSARVSLFHQGEHNVEFEADGYSDEITESFTRIDLAFKQKVSNRLSLFMNVNNLTNIEDGSYRYSRVYGRKLPDQSEKYGSTVDFGFTFQL